MEKEIKECWKKWKNSVEKERKEGRGVGRKRKDGRPEYRRNTFRKIKGLLEKNKGT